MAPALSNAFDRRETLLSGNMPWLAITPAATQRRADPQAGNTAAFQAKNIMATGINWTIS
jgi:hypothetical protein